MTWESLSLVSKGTAGCRGTPSIQLCRRPEILLGLQTVVSRKADLTAWPAVVTVGMINGGSRANVVPETVAMAGTIRTYDPKVRDQVARDVRLTAEKIAESAGQRRRCGLPRCIPLPLTTSP